MGIWVVGESLPQSRHPLCASPATLLPEPPRARVYEPRRVRAFFPPREGARVLTLCRNSRGARRAGRLGKRCAAAVCLEERALGVIGTECAAVCAANVHTVKVCVEVLPFARGAEAGAGARPTGVFRVTARPGDCNFEALLALALAVNHDATVPKAEGGASERARRHLEVSSSLVGRTNAKSLTDPTRALVSAELARLDARRSELVALLKGGSSDKDLERRSETLGELVLRPKNGGKHIDLRILARAASDAAERRATMPRKKRSRESQ